MEDPTRRVLQQAHTEDTDTDAEDVAEQVGPFGRRATAVVGLHLSGKWCGRKACSPYVKYVLSVFVWGKHLYVDGGNHSEVYCLVGCKSSSTSTYIILA